MFFWLNFIFIISLHSVLNKKNTASKKVTKIHNYLIMNGNFDMIIKNILFIYAKMFIIFFNLSLIDKIYLFWFG